MGKDDKTGNSTKQGDRKSSKHEEKKFTGKGRKDKRNERRSRSRSPDRHGRNRQGRSRSPIRTMGDRDRNYDSSEYKLYVGNLPKGVTYIELKKFFADLVRKGRDPDLVISGCWVKRTYAFLEFKIKRDVRTALKFDGVLFQGKKLTLNSAFKRDDKEDMAAVDPWGSIDSGLYTRTLWIWNVPPGVRGRDLMDFFNHLMVFTGLAQSPGNPVLSCQPAPNEEYFVIVLRSLAETAQVMLLDGINYMGSSLVITRPDDSGPVPGPAISNDAVQAAMLPISERLDRIVYVGNIVSGAVVEDMVKLFNKEMHLSGLAQIPGDAIVGFQYDPLKSVALLEFRTAVEARGAVALDGIAYLGRNLKIGWLTEFQQQLGNDTGVTSVLDSGGVSLAAHPLVENMDERELHSALERERWGAMAERFYTDDFSGAVKITPSNRASRNQCQLYVGLNSVTGDRSKLQPELLAFFNKRMMSAGLKLAHGNPAIDCMLKDSYCFIEFRSVEETTNALVLDGIQFRGRTLTIKRPSSYKSPKGGQELIASRPDRTIHVFPSTATTEYYMAQIIYHEMLRRGLTQSPGDPVISCAKKDRGTYFCVLLRYKEEAVTALALDNAVVGDMTIKVCSYSEQPYKRINEERRNSEKAESLSFKDEKPGPSQSSVKPECRVFVSNFPIGISEGELKDFFNKLMIQTGLAEKPGDCIDRCKIVPDTNFAYLEFRSASEANLALILDDLSFKGQKLKIKRPVGGKAADDAAKTRDVNPSVGADDNKINLERVPKQQQIPELVSYPLPRSHIAHETESKRQQIPELVSYPLPRSHTAPETGPKQQQISELVRYPPPRSSAPAVSSAPASSPVPAISSIIDHVEGMTDQVLKHVAEFQKKGLSGGAEFTAVADLLSVNISVLCANGARMTYHPRVGTASATIEIQNPKTAREVSQQESRSRPSENIQRDVKQESNFDSKSSLPSLMSIPVTAPTWNNSYQSSNSVQDSSRQSSSSAVRDNFGIAPSDLEVSTKPYTTTTTSSSGGAGTTWLIATWNVRGVTSTEKQIAIDQTLNGESVEIAAIQETHLTSTTFNSQNYKWLLSSDNTPSSLGGVGFMIRKDLVPLIVRWTPISDYLAVIHLRTNDINLIIISVLIPFDGSTTAGPTLDRLVSILSVSSSNAHIFVVGDFNAQIGANDVMGDDMMDVMVGQYLEHTRSNKNGLLLLRLIRETKLFHLSSLLGNSGTLITRTQSSESAQVDHILGNCPSSVTRVAAGFIPRVHTDHKIMWAITSVSCCPKHSNSSQ